MPRGWAHWHRHVDTAHPRLSRSGVVHYRLLGRAREDELTTPPDWYRDRPEPERRLRGILRPREVGPTPGGRDRLPFALVRPGFEDLPIYGPAAEDALAAAVLVEVELIGKVIDSRDAPGGEEFWLAGSSAVTRT